MRALWLGTRGYEQWVKMPAIDMSAGRVGFGEQSSHVNGGATVHNSSAGHQEYSLDWNVSQTADIEKVISILSGNYDTEANRGLLYFVDPAQARKNLFPELWASPFKCALGAPSLTKGEKPTLADTPSNSARLPARSATFTVTEDSSRLRLYVPIPEGHTARWAFYGPTEQADKIQITEYTGATAGTPVLADILDIDTYGTGLTSTATATGIEFALTDATGDISLTTALLQIAPSATVITAPSHWLQGIGHSGCQRDGDFDVVYHSVEHDKASMSVRLIETGSWL